SGDFIVLPHGGYHELSSCKGAGRDEYTTMLCGDVEFTHGARNPLLRALPELILVRAAEGGERFRDLAKLLCSEIAAGGCGGRAVVDKLADALFIMAVRHHINSAAEPQGLIAALLDARLCKALSAIHADPGRDWTVQSMAEAAGMSRTAFALRFA